MKKTLRTLIGLALALAVTSASAVPVGGAGLERVPATSTGMSSVIGN
ncbi:hypothetical protein [Deinococcus aerolatus]|nr:hypothetical protein [Deinococcus aerolatus]